MTDHYLPGTLKEYGTLYVYIVVAVPHHAIAGEYIAAVWLSSTYGELTLDTADEEFN